MGKIKTENIFVGNKHFLTPFNLADRLIVKNSEQSTPDWLFALLETITKVENQDENKGTFCPYRPYKEAFNNSRQYKSNI